MFKVLRVNHIAIATKLRDKQVHLYENILGLPVSRRLEQPDHGVYTTFIECGNTKIELLEELGENSPIHTFLKDKSEAVHHLCLEVDNLDAACAKMKSEGIRILGDKPKIGAHGKKVIFLHPKDTNGLLIEIEQV